MFIGRTDAKAETSILWQERFKKDLEEIKKSQYIMNNAIDDIKNTLGEKIVE